MWIFSSASSEGMASKKLSICEKLSMCLTVLRSEGQITYYCSGSLINYFPDRLPLPPALPPSLSHINAATHWHATYLLIYVISKFASHEAEWLGDKVLKIWWLHIYHWLNLFSSSAEERPCNKRNDMKLLSFNPKKGMKLFSESLGSTGHQSQADLQLKEIHVFAMNKGRQIDLLLSDFFPPDALPNESIRNHNSLLHKNEWPLQYTSKFEQKSAGWLCMTQSDEVAYLKL